MLPFYRPAAGEPPQMELYYLMTGFWVSRMLYVVTELGVADALKDGPKRSEELAQATDAHAGALYRVLRTLSSMGVFAEDAEGRFTLTPQSHYLRSDVPGSMRPLILTLHDEAEWGSWEHAIYSVRTGQPSFEHVFGIERFAYYEQNPEVRKTFDHGMAAQSEIHKAAVVGSYDFSGVNTLVDVGGGNGNLIAGILQTNPTMRGILFDLPTTIDIARERLTAEGVADRCTLVAGDFFVSVPTGGDTYVIQRCLHNWDDASVLKILHTIRQAVPSNGKFLIIEMLVPPGNEFAFTKLIDLVMLTSTHGGRERTEAEFQAMLASTGFALQRTIPVAASPLWIIEATPV